MLIAILVILIILWLLGYAPLSGLNLPSVILFTINGRTITLWDLLILLVVIWAIGILPYPLQTIAVLLLLVWILSTLGILAITGLSSIIVIVIILGLILAIFT